MIQSIVDMLSRIAPQPKSLLYAGLIDLIVEMRKPENLGRSKELLEKLSALIYRHSGIQTTITISGTTPNQAPNAEAQFEAMPTILSYPVLDISKDRETYRKLYDRMLKEPTYGTIDLQKGRVSGWYSHRPSVITMTSNFIYGRKITPIMVAAVLLHEVGHLFTYFATLHQTLNCAHLSAESTHEVMGANLSEINHLLTRKGVPDNTAATKEEALVKINKVIIDREFNQFSKASALGGYDSVSWEQLADDYASRHGAAIGLAEFLMLYPNEEYSQLSPDRGKAPQATAGCKSAMAMALMSIVPTVVPGSDTIVTYIATNLGANTNSPRQTYGDPEYDHLKDRVRHLKNSIVVFLKNPLLDPKDRDQFLDQYDTINRRLDELKDPNSESSIYWLYLKRDPRLRATLSQRQLAQLFHNELYVSASRIKALASTRSN